MPSHPWLLLLPLVAAAGAQQPVPPDELAAAIRLLEQLGYPAVADKPFVRVATGACFRSGNEPPQNTFTTGFLLGDDGRQFTVLTVDLHTIDFLRTAPGAAEHERVGFSPESLREFAKKTVQALRAADQNEPRFDLAFDGRPTPGRAVALFTLAWACQCTGDTELATELAAWSRASFRDRAGDAELHELLAGELSHVAMWRLILAFGDPSVPLATLLADCDRLLQQFPGCKHEQRAKETRTILARMVQELQAHPALPDDATEEQRIAELAFRLREQNGQQWSQPGSCDTFADPRGEQSPAHQLAAIGWKALPLLLPAFDDDSFTRSVGFHRDFYFSHQVLRVHDVAAAVASRIAGTWVRDKAEAERLWQQLQQHGERGLLIDGAERGNVEQAERLLRLDPAATLPALQKALALPLEHWQRQQVVAVLAGVPGDAALRLLRAELQRPPDHGTPLVAALAMSWRGERDAAIDAMIHAWQQARDADAAEAAGKFLAVCGARRAIEALAARKDQLDDDVLQALGEQQAWFEPVLLPDGTTRSGPVALGDLDPAAAVSLEHLLGTLLDDDRVFQGSWNATINPEVRDFAAQAMRARWPDSYRFDFDAPRPVRRQQILAARDVWRGKQGLPPLPRPPAPVIPAVDRGKVDDLLARARLERIATPRRAILDQIEALGLGAVPWIQAGIADAADQERTAELQALCARVASFVREVRLAEGSAPFPDDLRKQVQALAQRRLDPTGLVDLLCALCGDVPAAPAEVSVCLVRAEDGSGVVVEFGLWGRRGAGVSVSYSSSVSAGTRNLQNCSGAGVTSVAAEARHYDDFAKALAAALLTPMDQVVDARYRLSFR